MWTRDGLVAQMNLSETEQQADALSAAELSALDASQQLSTSTRAATTRAPSTGSTTPRFYWHEGRYWRLPPEWYARRRALQLALSAATTTGAPENEETTQDYEETENALDL